MRHRRRRDIIIELTPLLDVIMIIIFMVMKENGKMITDKQNTINAVQQVNSEQSAAIDDLNSKVGEMSSQLAEKLQAAENKLESYKAIDDIVIVLNIGLENKYNNTVRCLTFGKVSEQSSVTENRSDEEFGVSLNKLKVFVSDYITKVLDDSDNQTIVYIVFTYDPRKVFQRDYEAVGEALAEAEIKANNGNFRYRINPVSE